MFVSEDAIPRSHGDTVRIQLLVVIALAGWRGDGRKRYAPLLSFLDGKGYRVVDAMEVLDGAGRNLSIDELIPSHLSPLANMLVAEHLRATLAELRPRYDV